MAAARAHREDTPLTGASTPAGRAARDHLTGEAVVPMARRRRDIVQSQADLLGREKLASLRSRWPGANFDIV